MRCLAGLVCVLALGVMPLVGCSDSEGSGGSAGNGGSGGVGGDGGTSRPSEFTADDAVLVSGSSPYAECEDDARPDDPFFADSEVEPWLAINPTNPDHMAAAWQQDRYASVACRGNVVSVSFDGGEHWQESLLPKLTPCTGGTWAKASDPWVTFAANGDLYSATLAFTPATDTDPEDRGMLVHKSTDGGLTWGDPITVAETAGSLEDKESLTADPFDDCFVYLSWTRFHPPDGGDLLFSRTTDCGATWSEPAILYSNNPAGVDVQVAVLPDGTLVTVFVEIGPVLTERPFFAMMSGDRGETWTESPLTIATAKRAYPVVPDGGDTIRSGAHDIAVDRSTGTLHLVWERHIDDTPPTQIAYASSSDGGTTWSDAVRIDRTPPAETFEREQAFLPSVEVSSDGTIGITYYNFQNDTQGDARSDTDVWFIHCHPEDGDCNDPAQWSEAIRLTTESFDYQLAPTSNRGFFLGDYVGLAAAGSDFFALPSVTTPDDPADVLLIPIRGR